VEEPSVVPHKGKLGRRRLRELSEAEQQLLQVIGKKKWKVHCQSTPPKYQGAEAIVNYLSAYVSGAAIGNSRLISDDGERVTFRYKDYRTNDKKKLKTLFGSEFTQRFCEHILPSRLPRVRYSGLFTAAGRVQRMAHCRALIAAAAGRPQDAPSQVTGGDSPSQAGSAEQTEHDEEIDEECAVPTGCTCRHCHGKLEVVGRLKGTPTLELARMLLLLFPSMMDWVATDFIEQCRTGFIRPRHFPQPVRKEWGHRRWESLELEALAALLESYPQSGETGAAALSVAGAQVTGIPPPEISPEVYVA